MPSFIHPRVPLSTPHHPRPCRAARGTPGRVRLLLALLLPWVLDPAASLTAQTPPVVINYNKLLFHPSPRVSYVAPGLFQNSPVGMTNFFLTARDGAHMAGDSLYAGDKVRIRTVGSYAVAIGTNPDGSTQYSTEEPRAFLGLYAGAVGELGASKKIYFPADTGLPGYVTPTRTVGTRQVITDTQFDFLIPPDGVTFCMPPYGNFLCLLNPDPNAVVRDVDGDFGIEIEPLEKARLLIDAVLSTTNIVVGDLFTITINLQSIGNVPVMNIDTPHQAFNTNLLELVSGPIPTLIPSIAPGSSDKFTFTFRATGASVVAWQFPLYMDACGGHYELWAATVGITTIHDALTAEVAAAPRIIGIGQEFSVDLRAVNNSAAVLTNVQPAGPLTVAGDGGVALASGPDPAGGVTLPGGAASVFHYTFTGTNAGQVTFSGSLTGWSTNGVVNSPTNSSRTLLVSPGNLLVKRAIEPESLYAGREEYFLVPAPPQIKTNAVALNEESRFDVEVVNVDSQPRTFTLTAVPDSRPGWTRTYFLGSADVSAQVESAAGLRLPALPAGEAFDLQVVMVPTNGAAGDLKRIDLTLGLDGTPGMVLDSIEVESAVALELVVNSTGDLPAKDPTGCCCDTGRTLSDGTPECSLRAAIQIANAHPGKDIIRFDIPSDDPNYFGGIPLIPPRDALPDITDPVIIDGGSQNPQSTRPAIELSGAKIKRPPPPSPGQVEFGEDLLDWSGAAMGLKVLAPESEIRGLVVNSFPLCGIGLGPEANHSILQGNFIGTDTTGTSPLANGFGADSEEFLRGCGILVTSSDNLIGGDHGNLISGVTGTIWNDTPMLTLLAPPGIFIATPAATGNQVLGNILGLDVNGTEYMQEAVAADGTLRTAVAGVWIASSPGNSVGGFSRPDAAGSTAGNLIGANGVGVLITGAEATGNQVSGNVIGVVSDSPSGAIGVFLNEAGRNLIGGDSAGLGNVISSHTYGLLVQGAEAVENVVQGNFIGSTQGSAAPGTLGSFAGNHHGVVLGGGATGTVIAQNHLLENLETGIYMENAADTLVVTNVILRNGLQGSADSAGVRVVSGSGNTLSANSIFDNGGLGIALGLSGDPLANDPGDGDSGPNDRQNHPVLQPGGPLGSDLEAGSYRIELFASSAANPSGYGEGEQFLGAIEIVVPSAEHTLDGQYLGFGIPGNAYVSATATAPDGSTSEFSESILVQDCVPGPGGICPSLENQVPNLVTNAGAPPPLVPASVTAGGGSSNPPPPASTGDGNGDGVPDAQQENVASLPTIRGPWVTLAVPAGATLQQVRSSGPPDFSRLPSGVVFPLGFLHYTVTSLPAGGSVVVTELPHWLPSSPPPRITTVYNYGRTPDNREPHWYEFSFDGTTGAEILADRILLHLHDGGRGDDDLAADGSIRFLGGVAVGVASAPELELVSVAVGSEPQAVLRVGSDGRTTVVTEEVPAVTTVLAWPTTATGYQLFYRELPAAPPGLAGAANPAAAFAPWRRVPGTPAVEQGRLKLVTTSTRGTRFFSLRPAAGK